MADDKNELIEQPTEQIDLTPQLISHDKNMWNDVAIMKQAWKMADMQTVLW